MNSVVSVCIQILEVLFAIGCVGSVVVIILSGVEDVETIFSSQEEEEQAVPAHVEK